MKNFQGYYEGRETRKLFYQKWTPDSGRFKAIVIGIHGWGTHSDRMEIPAIYFVKHDYALYSFDLRGHWRNAGELPGHIDSMDHIQKDIVLFKDFILKEVDQKKVFLMGHSFGGLVSIIFAINHPAISGVLISSPLLGMFKKLSIGKKVIKTVSKTISKLAPTKILNNIIDQNQLTSDLKILRKHISDNNRTNVISAKSASEIDKFSKWAMDNARNLSCPILVMQAGKDKIVDRQKTKEFFGQVKSKDKKYKEYEGFLHELWNEKGRAQVFQDMYIWLEKHLK
ncbi:hypothetical protein LCGC14_0611580 [marine sediment metagenome]|uniref:Serine aminopeptidase S33 domain-containing protein n=1 Tax=marine sediment metagenome TaxID=412755 RepID=A0A0F9RC82_9ZZZZ